MCSYMNKKGFSLLEMLLATVVGGIVLAGAYASYSLIAKQYKRITTTSELQSAGVPAIDIVSRDIRMAGHAAIDPATLNPVMGSIADPIIITDSGDACCDSISVIYDQDNVTRVRISYSTVTSANDSTTNTLLRDVDQYDPVAGSWANISSNSVVVDYVEDFQLVGSQDSILGYPQLVDISVVLRSRGAINKAVNYTKEPFEPGEYNYNFNDNFHRENFYSTVPILNLKV